MEPLGFWRRTTGREGGDTSLPDPRELVDAAWAEGNPQLAQRVVAYCRSAHVESYEMGYSHCRFSACDAEGKELGCCNMTDGRFVWPEGYAHYIEKHAVRPPHEFVQHVQQQPSIP